MAATLTSLIASVRERFDDPNERVTSDAAITRYINEILADVARRTKTLQAVDTVAFASGVSQVDAPADVLELSVAQISRDSDPINTLRHLAWRDLHSFAQNPNGPQPTGTPQFFTAYGFAPSMKLVVYPAPDEDHTMTLNYYRTPTVLATGTDVAEIPAGWEDLIVDGAEYKVLRTDRDARWSEAKAEYEQHVNALLEDSYSLSDQQGMIDTPHGMLPEWLAVGDW